MTHNPLCKGKFVTSARITKDPPNKIQPGIGLKHATFIEDTLKICTVNFVKL